MVSMLVNMISTLAFSLALVILQAETQKAHHGATSGTTDKNGEGG
jgi:hypothetical protein